MTLKKLICLLAAVAVLAGLLTTVSFAADAEDTVTENYHETTELPTAENTELTRYLGAYQPNADGSGKTLYLISGTSSENGEANADGNKRVFPTTSTDGTPSVVKIEYWTAQSTADAAVYRLNIVKSNGTYGINITLSSTATIPVASQNGSAADNYSKVAYTGFSWNSTYNLFYQVENVTSSDENAKIYVLGMTTTSTEVRCYSLAEVLAEDSDIIPVRMFAKSACSYDTPNHDEIYHWDECSCGNIANKAEHTYGDPVNNGDGTYTWTCTDTDCGYAKTGVDHECDSNKLAFDADGHWYACSNCNKQMTDTVSHTLEPVITDTQHQFTCDCGYATELENHDWEWVVDEPATEDTVGHRSRTCSICTKSEENDIPRTLAEGAYYLAGNVNGTTYYFRMVGSGERVTDTDPFSVYTTTDISAAGVTVIAAKESYDYDVTGEKQYTIVVGQYNGADTMIYVYDNTNTTGVDTGTSSTFYEVRHLFRWDADSGRLYQMETVDGVEVKYILAFTMMDNTAKDAQTMQLLAIPEDDARFADGTAWPATLLPALKFSGASLALENNLAVRFNANSNLFAEDVYSDPYAVFSFNGKDYTVTDYTVTDSGKYAFQFSGIAPHQLGDTITATLYATYNGQIVSSEAVEYSVLTYCTNKLAAEDSSASLKKLLADLLNYGAAAQTHMGYNTESLVNASLDQDLATGTTPDLKSHLNTQTATVENPAAKWKSATLVLENAVTIRLKFEAADVSGLTVMVNGQQASFVDTGLGDNTYYVYYNGLHAGQMSEVIQATVYSGETAVSNTLSYSIETYACNKQTVTTDSLGELVVAMMKYGNSAAAYTG